MFSLLVIKLYNLQIIQIEYHAKNLALLQEKVIEGTSAPAVEYMIVIIIYWLIISQLKLFIIRNLEI